MSQEPDRPAHDSPDFEPSPGEDQPATPLPTRESVVPVAQRPTDPAKPLVAAKPPAAARPAPPAHPTPARAGATSLISNALMMLLGAGLAAGGYGLARVYAPPGPAGEKSSTPPPDMVKADDFKKLTDRVDHMATDVDQAKKQIADRPDFGPQIKMQNDRINEVTQSVTQIPPQLDSINQKLTTYSKVEASSSPASLDALDKRVAETSHALDALRADVAAIQRSGRGSGGGGGGRGGEGNVDGLAMDQAVELFNAKKYTDARNAFQRLQTAMPNDARVWYYSALSTGFSTGQWLNETERMAITGLEKEKAGQPDSSLVDATFANLTPSTGKDWLAGYRKRINAR